MANEVIGHWRCDAGGQANVMQTKRRGHHLYTNCDCCGLDQRTGAARQTKLWNESQFFAGVTVKKPANVTEQTEYVTDSATEHKPESEPEQTGQQAEQEPDWEPEETDEETEPEPSRSWPRLLAGVSLIGGAVGGWLWTRNK